MINIRTNRCKAKIGNGWCGESASILLPIIANRLS